MKPHQRAVLGLDEMQSQAWAGESVPRARGSIIIGGGQGGALSIILRKGKSSLHGEGLLRLPPSHMHATHRALSMQGQGNSDKGEGGRRDEGKRKDEKEGG